MLRKHETVLIGTSLSNLSDEVVRSGLGLARAMGGKVYLLHAFLPRVTYSGGGAPFVTSTLAGEVAEAEQRLLAQKMDEQVERLGIRPEELLGTALEEGPAHRSLIDAAGKFGADLIVLGATEAPRRARFRSARATPTRRSSPGWRSGPRT